MSKSQTSHYNFKNETFLKRKKNILRMKERGWNADWPGFQRYMAVIWVRMKVLMSKLVIWAWNFKSNWSKSHNAKWEFFQTNSILCVYEYRMYVERKRKADPQFSVSIQYKKIKYTPQPLMAWLIVPFASELNKKFHYSL